MFRTCLEALIRRLHLHGYTAFYAPEAPEQLTDTNVLAWIEGTPADVGLARADLVAAPSRDLPLRAYIFHLGSTILAGADLFTRLNALDRQLRSRNANPRESLTVLIRTPETTVPERAPAHLFTNAAALAYRIEGVSLSPESLVYDYLRMSQANIFNSSNTPVAPSLIAEGLGLTRATVLQACERLWADRRIEAIRAGSQAFYRAR